MRWAEKLFETRRTFLRSIARVGLQPRRPTLDDEVGELPNSYTAKAHLLMDCIAKTSVAESSDERASNVQSGLALPAIICPISNSIRFILRPWEAGQDRRVKNT